MSEVTVEALALEVEALKSNVESYLRQKSEAQLQVRSMRSAVEAWIVEAHANEIDKDALEELANQCQISLTKTRNVTVAVTFDLTVDMPLFYDEDDLQYAFSFEADSSDHLIEITSASNDVDDLTVQDEF